MSQRVRILSVSIGSQSSGTLFSHGASLTIYCKGGGRREKQAALLYIQERNCLFPQRQLGRFGLCAHIVKTVFVLKPLEGFFNILNIPVSSRPLPIL
jgi:hypothetical protein